MKETNVTRRRELAMVVYACLSLAACGGGGGSKSGGGNPVVVVPPPPPPPPVPPPAPPTVPVDPDPPADPHLALIGADTAHAAGLTGKGQKVVVVDSGVLPDHPALSGRVVKQLSYVDPSLNDTSVGDVTGHGTAVAQILAGAVVGKFAGGVAPEATIVSARVVGDKEDVHAPSTSVTSTMLADLTAQTLDASVIVHTWGGMNWDPYYDYQTGFDIDRAVTQYRFNVAAAGDSGLADPTSFAALPTSVGRNPRTGWLTVVALDEKDPTQIASYSNRCGVAAGYCLAAPGTVVTMSSTSTAEHPVYQTASGTAMAAAQVGGAVALVQQQFPGMGNDAVWEILLGTADDLGAPGPDNVYGYGRVNIARAIRGPSRLDFSLFQVDLAAGHSAVFGNDISGAGQMWIRTGTNDTLTLAGHNSYAGETRLLGGNLDVTYGVPGEFYSVLGSTTTMHGDFGSLADVSGRLITGDTPVHVHGKFTLRYFDSMLSVKLGAPLIVDGAASLDGKLEILGAVPGYTTTAHQTILSASSITGSFAQLVMGQGVFLSSTLQYTPSEVWLDTRSLNITQVATTSMSRSMAAISSAQRLDGAFAQIDKSLAPSSTGGNEPDLSMLVAAGGIQQSRDTKTAQASLESLSGQLYAAGTAVTLAGIEAGNEALVDHLDRQGAVGAWTQALGYQGGLSRSGFGSVGVNLGGSLVGADVPIGHTGFAGLAVGQLRSTGQLAGNFDRQRNRATEGMAYAGARGDHWYGVGRFGFGGFRGDMRRLLRFGEQGAFAGSETTGRYNMAYAETGYRTQVGAFSLTPFANLQYATIQRSAFEEGGGDGFGLSANSQTTSRWELGLGVRAGASWLTSLGRLRFDGKLGWQNAFATRGEAFSARYTGIAQWAPVEGIGLSRQAGTAGFALGWDLSERAQLGMDVDQRLADRDHSRSASARFRLAW